MAQTDNNFSLTVRTACTQSALGSCLSNTLSHILPISAIMVPEALHLCMPCYHEQLHLEDALTKIGPSGADTQQAG